MNTKNLIKLREESKKTQREIATNLKLNFTTYNNYETNKAEPKLDTLIKIADYYKVSLDYLVGRDFGTGLGFLSEEQITFIKTFLLLNSANQTNAVIYVANLLANQ